MIRNAVQILPEFERVSVMSQGILKAKSLYNIIYGFETVHHFLTDIPKTAWLIDENMSLSEFIDRLGRADDESENYPPLNLYDFYAAKNITFPAKTVKLINEIHIEHESFTDFAELLNAFAGSKVKYLQHAVYLDARRVPYSELCVLRRKILQQFVYLRIYMPVIIAYSYGEADNYFQIMLHSEERPRSVSVFGTKKSGKSTLINAMLEGEYFPYSSELPTPCKVVCSEGRKGDKIRLDYAGKSYIFEHSGELREFLAGEFRKANKASSALEEMRILLPAFPEKLRNISIADTPGSNFAAAEGHHDTAFSALAEAEGGIFVLNYSAHLSNDEAELLGEFFGKFSPQNAVKPVVIALNRIDEMYAADVVKSYERAADYIASRLEALGWENFVIVPVSALTGVYAGKLGGAVEAERGKMAERLEKIADGGLDSAAEFLSERVREKKRFYGKEVRTMRELGGMSRVKYFVHVVNALC